MSGFSGAPASASTNPPTTSGQLTFVSTAALAFLPYNGDTIRIGGTVMQIPAAGIAGLGAPTSVFLNGVAAQTLVINTTYLIYAFSNSGTVTADFSTTGHSISATAGNIGTEIKTGDSTRTLIGMVRTGATVIYASNMQTASWFNPGSKLVEQSQSLAAAGQTTAISFVSFANQDVHAGMAGLMSNGTTGQTCKVQPRIDGGNVSPNSYQGASPGGTNQFPMNLAFNYMVSEGNHTYDHDLNNGGGSGTVALSATSFVRIRG